MAASSVPYSPAPTGSTLAFPTPSLPTNDRYSPIPGAPHDQDIELHPVLNSSKESSHFHGSQFSSSNHKFPKGQDRHKLEPPRRASHIVRALWVTAWLPLVSLAYLAVCYTAYRRTVKVQLWNIENPVNHLSIVKAGVTTISILVITIALLPIRSLISDLRSEEFFRILSLKSRGVPLAAINSISTPSFGTSETISAIVRRQCSTIFASAVFVTLVGVAASALAPAALSVRVIQINGDLMAFRTGAIFRNTVWNSTNEGVFRTPPLSSRLPYAAAIPWMDMAADSRYGRTAMDETQYNYIVPVALDVPLTARVRYLTDIVHLKPVCQWVKPDGPPAPKPGAFSNKTLAFNFTSVGPKGISIEFSSSTGISSSYNTVINTWDVDPFMKTFIDMSGDPVVDGTTFLSLGQCRSGCRPSSYSEYNPIPDVRLNLGNIPTTPFSSTTFSNATTEWDLAFLVCSPNAQIEAREVETDDKGRIVVMPAREESGRPQQGNLERVQTNVLLGQALSKLPESGPPIGHLEGTDGLGGAGQVTLIFGREQTNPKLQGRYFTEEEAVLTPLPLPNITANYARALHGSMKAFLDGSLAVTYVPGRTYQPTLVFDSSLPHLVISTIVFGLLSLFLIVCHFRTPVPQFTFFHIATALSKSDCPSIFEDIKLSGQDGKPIPDHVAFASVGDRSLAMRGTSNGNPTIVMH